MDWEGVEADYRAGIDSARTIATRYGISESAVRFRAKADGWVKGDAHAVRALAHQKADNTVLPKTLPPAERIEALAEAGAQVLVRHRTAVSGMASLVADMVQQLHHQTHNEDVLGAELREYFMLKAAENPLMAGQYRQQMNNALHAIGLGARSKTMANLTASAGKLIELERKAWKLDDVEERAYEDVLAELLDRQEAADA